MQIASGEQGGKIFWIFLNIGILGKIRISLGEEGGDKVGRVKLKRLQFNLLSGVSFLLERFWDLEGLLNNCPVVFVTFYCCEQ